MFCFPESHKRVLQDKPLVESAETILIFCFVSRPDRYLVKRLSSVPESPNTRDGWQRQGDPPSVASIGYMEMFGIGPIWSGIKLICILSNTLSAFSRGLPNENGYHAVSACLCTDVGNYKAYRAGVFSVPDSAAAVCAVQLTL